MNTIREAIGKRRVFTSIFISLLCISVLAFAVTITWAQVYAAIDAVLNAITGYQSVKALIKDLDDQIREIQDDIDNLNVRYYETTRDLARSAGVLASHKSNLEQAKTALANATRARESAESAVSTAQSQYNSASTAYDNAKDAYLDHIGSCHYCVGSSMCYDGTMYHNSMTSAYTALQSAKSTLKSAKDTLKSCKSAETYANGQVSIWIGYVQSMEIIVNSIANSIKAQGEVLKIKAELKDQKVEEYEAAIRKRDALRINIPILMVYMDTMIAAWSAEYPEFDWTEYFEQNPIPEIEW